MFASFQPNGTYPHSQYCWKIIERGLILTLASPLSTLHESHWMNPIDLYASTWSSKSHTSSVLSRNWSLPQSQSSNSGHLECQSPSSVLKTKLKKSLNICTLFRSLFVRLPFSSSKEAMLSLVLLLLLTYSKRKPYYCTPQYWLASTLTELWLHVFFSLQWQTASLQSSNVAWLHFQWLYFLFCLSSRRRSLLSQASLLPCFLKFWHFGIPCFCALQSGN